MRQIVDRSGACETDGEREAYFFGVEDVLYLRCIKHKDIRQLNWKENKSESGGECAICQIETLLAHGQPGFHVLRLVGNSDISAGKGRELLIDVLLGKIGLGDLPCFNAGLPELPSQEGSESVVATNLRLRWDFVNAAKLNHNHGGHSQDWELCGWDVCQRARIEEQLIPKGTRP